MDTKQTRVGFIKVASYVKLVSQSNVYQKWSNVVNLYHYCAQKFEPPKDAG